MPDGSLQLPARPVTIRHLLMHTSGTRSRGDAWFKHNDIPVSSAASLETYVGLLLKAPLQDTQSKTQNLALNKGRENGYPKSELFRLRTDLVKSIDPLPIPGTDLHGYFLTLMPQYCDAPKQKD